MRMDPGPPCLTLLQPWASLIFDGPKVHETRSWPIPDDLVGQRLVIHASSRHVKQCELPPLLAQLVAELWSERPEPLPYGAALGSVRVVGCLRTEHARPASREDEITGDWGPGRWVWRLAEARAFAVPRPMRGARRIWYAERPELLLEGP